MTPPSPTEAGPSRRGLSRGRLLFVGVLLLIGTGFLALAAYRAWNPNPPGRKAEPDLAREAQEDLQRRGFKPLSEPLQRLLGEDDYQSVPTQAPPLLLQPAPDFVLEQVEGRPWNLREQLARGPVVLVFYYGYTCNHCVSQLFALNKDLDKFKELGAQVVAVSADPLERTRQQFAKYGAFAFPVLSDPGNKVAASYGVYRARPNSQEGDLMHGTFVITRQGKIVWVNSGDEPFTENRTLLIELAQREGRFPQPKR